jgi:hypothetical protein
MIGSLIQAPLFGSMGEDEECDHDHTLIDYSSAQGSDKEIIVLGEDNSNACTNVVIDTELMQSHVENSWFNLLYFTYSFNVLKL